MFIDLSLVPECYLLSVFSHLIYRSHSSYHSHNTKCILIADCYSGFMRLDSTSCVRFLDMRESTFEEAKKACGHLGSHLLHDESSNKDALLKDYITLQSETLGR